MHRHPSPLSASPFCASILALSLITGCRGQPLGGPDAEDYNRHPEPPALFRDVAMVDDDNQWNGVYVPGGLRTTQDGRVALQVQGGPDTFSFYLYAPEKMNEAVLPGAPGMSILATPDPVRVVFPPAQDPDVYRVGHHAICDPTHEFPVEGERTNPYACGTDLANDCYDIHIISSISIDTNTRMWGTPATIEVSNPKTVDARIANVSLGEPVAGTTLGGAFEWAEAAITIDGRLLTGRWGGAIRSWTHPESGESFIRRYDLGYSYLDESYEPCDITGWTDFHPMSHAPYDPELVGRYGLAQYPFRDSEGELIADGEDMGGSYPWVDREGANVFMTGVPGTIHEQSKDDFPRTCVVEGCEDLTYSMDFDRGFLVAGAWTHGRLVHLDGMINNIDWSIGLAPDAHMMVDLYQDTDGTPVAARLGAGRGHSGSPPPPGHPGNENILDSQQNMPNFRPAMRHVTPRDVVWIMSSGVATDEIAFDDFLDPRAFIVSNMQASITQVIDDDGRTTGVPWHHNGQVRDLELGLVSNLSPYELVHDEYDDVHIQNAATSLDFAVPAYGLVEAGTGRTEPTALGGFYGRGFWLDGVNRIRYALPAQDLDSDWYVGIFVDARSWDGATRALMTFPDGSSVRLVEGHTVQYVADERVLHSVELPAAGEGWRHLAWFVREDHRELTLLVDGFPLDRYEARREFFGMGEGELILGRAGDRRNGEPDAGVRGWIDDFKVLAHDVDAEVACNHAGGTLIRVDDNAAWADTAALYPDWAHEEVAAAAGLATDARYACFHDYSADFAAHLGNLPEGSTSVRDAILFPEGPLMVGAPRPDSSSNAFCLSCHHEDGKAGMGLGALSYTPNVPLEEDRRRQPLQPLRRVFGNVPAGWIPADHGPGSPMEPLVAPNEGLLVDPWVLPAAE
ncbi:MAG: hypothetical protein EP330_14380 [Deltaproteobacteria bacterium]|nr:MAG: hypothetical protein EP330_14380 [Deltaproteobacteria bacterium]